jgi:DNA invertase Pin-like site-specific DNA recombinase
MMLDEFNALGVAFVSLQETIDTTTPAGRLSMQVIGAVAEYERSLIRDRVGAGIARAKASGIRLGRPRSIHPRFPLPLNLTVRGAAAEWGVSKSTAARWIASGKVPTGPSKN